MHSPIPFNVHNRTSILYAVHQIHVVMTTMGLIFRLSHLSLVFGVALMLCLSVPVFGASADRAGDSSAVGSGSDLDTEISANTPQLETTESAPPNISVAINGATVSNGGKLTTTNDPDLRLHVTSDAKIEIVSVRIDDETRRSYAPNATSLSQTATLKLHAGHHELSVVVRTTEGTSTYSSTLIEDSAAPLVTFESPFEAGFVGPNGSYEQLNSTYTLNKSNIDIRGTIHDRSNVEEVVIEREYRYQYGGKQKTSDDQIVISTPGDSIAESLQLGPYQPDTGTGVNILQIELRDEMGYVRVYETTIKVNGSEPPSISIFDRELVETRSRVRIQAEATDQIGLASVGFRSGSGNSSYGQQYLFNEHQPSNYPVSKVVSPTVRVGGGTKNITLIATNHAGKTTTKEILINHTELITPIIRFDRSATRSLGTGGIKAVGEVYDGQITSVHIEALSPEGDIVDITSVHSDEMTDSLTFDEELSTSSYPATIRVRAVDSTGVEHTRAIELSPPDTGSTSPDEVEEPPESDETNSTNATQNNNKSTVTASSSSDSGLLPIRIPLLSEIIAFVTQHTLITIAVGIVIYSFPIMQRVRTVIRE